MTVLDSQGHLIVAGGQQANQALLNDVYRSSFSFSDISAVTKACNLRVPLCGVGLGCLPSSAGFRRLPGNLGVTCTACPAAYAPTNLDFVRLSGEAAWSPRSSGNMEQIMKRISWTNVFGQTLTVPAGAFVMQGNDNHIENDGQNLLPLCFFLFHLSFLFFGLSFLLSLVCSFSFMLFLVRF